MVSPTGGSQTPFEDRQVETARPHGNIAGRNVSNATGSNSLEFVTSTISSPSLSPRDLTGHVVAADALTGEPMVEELEDLRKWVNQHTGLQIKTVDELLKLEELDLSDKNLTKLPSSIGFLKQLKTLLLAGNQLNSLPESIGSLSQLEKLWVNVNQLISLPESIGSLSQLEALYLSSNKLTLLPESIGSLSQLKNLDLRVNKLTLLPKSIGSLNQLKTLWLYRNQLTALPESIGSLIQLEAFYLSGNKLTSLPESIGSLSQLKELWLSENQLKSLPESIGLLSRLQELWLYRNQLKSLPKSIGSLSLLKGLWLTENKLASIPAALGQCLNLTQLTFHHNQDLATLPMSLGQIPGITDLDITDTKIPPDERDAILAECQALRANETNKTLPRRIETWKIFAKSTVDLGAITEFDEQQKRDVNEWLVRLERTSDFSREQHALASIVCNMLKTVIENQEFREQYFSQIGVNLEACEDRAAMSLNEIYTSWRLATLPQNASMREKLKLMTQAAKTFALREVLAGRINDQQKKRGQIERESVEIYLYYEIVLQKRLDLLTAIKHMNHDTIGKRDWIQEEDLIKVVETNYFYQLLNISAFEKMVAKEEWFQKIDHQFQEKLEELESKREPLSSAEYVGQMNAIKAKRKEAIVLKICDWLPAQIGGSDG